MQKNIIEYTKQVLHTGSINIQTHRHNRPICSLNKIERII